jgi:hypothetical protein
LISVVVSMSAEVPVLDAVPVLDVPMVGVPVLSALCFGAEQHDAFISAEVPTEVPVEVPVLLLIVLLSWLVLSAAMEERLTLIKPTARK